MQIVLQGIFATKSPTDEEISPAQNDAENTAEYAAKNSAVNVAGKYFQQ